MFSHPGWAFLRLPLLLLIVSSVPWYPETALAQYELQSVPTPSNYGGAGLLDTRTARFFPEGYLTMTMALGEPDDRYAVAFQALPWAELIFRYAINRGIPDANYSLHDRSFDVKIRLANESEYVPEIAVGLQDVLGTGVYSGEYFVGSKRWGPFDFSLGLGWGRLGSRGTFNNPFTLFGSHFQTRPGFSGLGGVPLFSTYFRGPDVGLFGGIQFATPVKNVDLKLEYSSDAYVQEKAATGRDYSFPLNIGVSYRPWPWLDVGASWLHGRIMGLRISTLIDVNDEIWPVRLDPPPRFRARPEDPAETITHPQAWRPDTTGVQTRVVDLTQPQPIAAAVPEMSDSASISPGADVLSPMAPAPPVEPTPSNATAGPEDEILAPIRTAITGQKVVVLGLHIEDDKIIVLIENGRYRRDDEAIARAARALSATAPAEIEYFEITVSRAGLPLTTVTLLRTQIDKLARNEGSPTELLQASDLKPASAASLEHIDPELFPKFNLSAYPVFRQSLFDPNNPVYVEFGVGATGSIRLTRNWFIEGSVTANLYNDFNQIARTSNSVLPHVRSDLVDYLQQGSNRIESLTTSYLFKLAPEIYGRASAGYLEWMFAGVGGEVLYRPFGQRWALGADLWDVRQREFNGLFALRSYQAITGHVSAYYSLPWHDIDVAVHAGQYLAGDKGVTFEISRHFLTGVVIGAWFTKTNVSSAQFGEGSFDKGIRIYIPFEWPAPFATQSGYDLELRAIQRDGGQELLNDHVLYGLTESSDYGQLSQQWNSVFK